MSIHYKTHHKREHSVQDMQLKALQSHAAVFYYKMMTKYEVKTHQLTYFRSWEAPHKKAPLNQLKPLCSDATVLTTAPLLPVVETEAHYC